MIRHHEFAGLSFVAAAGWCDITDDLPPDSPPTLACPDGVGALQVSTAMYAGGVEPAVDTNALSEMLQAHARARGFEILNQATSASGQILIVSGDVDGEHEVIRIWYVTDSRNVALITYVSQEPENVVTKEELRAADAMVRSIRSIDPVH